MELYDWVIDRLIYELPMGFICESSEGGYLLVVYELSVGYL